MKFNVKSLFKILMIVSLFNCRNKLNTNYKTLEERIFYSMYEQDLEKFKKYFDILKDKNSRDNLGNNLLHVAVERDLLDFYTYLLANGVTTIAFNNKNILPEELSKNDDLTNKLKKRRAIESIFQSMREVNAQTLEIYTANVKEDDFDEGINILTICLENIKRGLDFQKSLKIFKILINKYPSFLNKLNKDSSYIYNDLFHFNKRDLAQKNPLDSGKTPLHTAIEFYEKDKSFLEFIKLILQSNGDVYKEDLRGSTPLEMILMSKDEDLINIFKNIIKNNLKENIKEKLDFFEKEKDILLKKIDSLANLRTDINEKNFYYLIGCFINSDLKFIEQNKEYISTLILSFILPGEFQFYPSIKNVCEENSALYSNYKMFDLGAWISLIREQKEIPLFLEEKDKIELQQKLIRLEYQVNGHLLESGKDLIKNKEEIFKKSGVKISNNFYEDPFFKDEKGIPDQFGAETARERMKKISSLVAQMKNRNLEQGLKKIITRLYSVASVCPVGFLEELTNILIECLGGVEKKLEQDLGLKVYKLNEYLLENAINKFNEGKNANQKIDYRESNHHMLHIKKSIGLVDSKIIDSTGEDYSENLKKAVIYVRNLFKNEYKKIVEEETKSGAEMNKIVYDYFSKLTGSIEGVGELIFNESHPNAIHRNIALSLLLHENYISLKKMY